MRGGGRAPKPLLLYVPGLDGTGFAASPQFDSLSKYFTLVAFNIPAGDRTSFAGLVTLICDFLEIERDRPSDISTITDDGTTTTENKKEGVAAATVYLWGESMGGLLSLGVAQARPDLVDTLVLVNPASSFDKSSWTAVEPLLRLLPNELYTGLTYAVAPVLFITPRLVQGEDYAPAFASSLLAK